MLLYDKTYSKLGGKNKLRLATEEEKQELLDALEKAGKRWNAEKLCIEDIPVRKFKKGDKVRIKDGISSKTHYNTIPAFVGGMDKFIGKELTVENYSEGGFVIYDRYYFSEDWLEPYVEDIPKRKFKAGDKVKIKDGISSKTHCNIYPWFLNEMDDLIGKTMTVDRYTDGGKYVACEETESIFREDWLEPYEELKEGDLAIFWDNNKESAMIGKYDYFIGDVPFPHRDHRGDEWKNAIKFESKEQYERLTKGEI
jgi:uncharacterized protein YodC (DUF2158 family)